MRIKLQVMNLEKRETTPGGGRPQDFFRMLLLVLGPDGPPCTATEYLRTILPGFENQKLVAFHAAKLNNLMNCPENPCDPDNQDEINEGKAVGRKIPKRWTRRKWLTRISDKRYQELWELDQLLKHEIPLGKVFFYDTEKKAVVSESINRPSVIQAKPVLTTLETLVAKVRLQELVFCARDDHESRSLLSPFALPVVRGFQARSHRAKPKSIVLGALLLIALTGAVLLRQDLKQSAETLYRNHISKRQTLGKSIFHPVADHEAIRNNWKKREKPKPNGVPSSNSLFGF